MTKLFPKQSIYRGKESCASLLAHEIKDKRIMLVTGEASYPLSGAEDFLKPLLQNETVMRFHGFAINPEIADLKKGLNQLKQFNPDCIVAVGGGTALDIAKLLNHFHATGTDPEKSLTETQPEYLFKPQPLIAIPTTAGTGSEATHFAVLYCNHVKHSIAHPLMLPDHILLIPELTDSMSPYQTACTGLDALAQGIESFWAKGATKESIGYAEKAVKLSLRHLQNAVQVGDNVSRAGMQEAALWSGKAINISKTTLCHALSYSMTSHHGYPHGHAVALFLSEAFHLHLKYNAVPKSLLDIFQTGAPAEELSSLIERLGLAPKKALKTEEIDLVISEINPDRMGNNPVQPTQNELNKLVLNSLA